MKREEFKMDGFVTKEGFLYVQKRMGYLAQMCPYNKDTRCGLHCPLLGIEERIDETLVVIRCGATTVRYTNNPYKDPYATKD